MVELPYLIYQGINTSPKYELLKDKILKFLSEDEEHAIKVIYEKYFDNKDPESVVSYHKHNKLLKRKKSWTEKVKTGYESYRNGDKLSKGFAKHLVDIYSMMKDYEDDKGLTGFQKMFKESSAEAAIEKYIQELEQWHSDKNSMLAAYPFFSDLTSNQKATSVEIDLILIMGEWLVNNLHTLSPTGIEDGLLVFDEEEYMESKKFVEQAPTSALEHPYWGVAKKGKSPLNKETTFLEDGRTHFEVKKKKDYELDDSYNLVVDSEIIESFNKHVKTPDMFDSKIFIDLINRRDKNFQKNRRIRVYLSELLDTHFNDKSQKSYKELTERLLRLGYFRIAQREGDSVRLRSLFSEMTIEREQGNNDRWYLMAYVSDSVYDNILKEQYVSIYNKKIQELENNLAYHLSFIIQKERILSYKSDSEDISFELSWSDLSSSIRFNKRSKKENFDEIEAALEEIKQKDFIVKGYKRYTNVSFFVTCHPLNKRELQDMNSKRLNLNSSSDAMILGS
ncbi:hypothetical protein [Terribacillus sp. JSM ZJ617]|uniref:hypothetical protein n=1 Tax=Terribacillus sp. JSM ZJ617 TaxID=3342119 RepID=UPI0035A95077